MSHIVVDCADDLALVHWLQDGSLRSLSQGERAAIRCARIVHALAHGPVDAAEHAWHFRLHLAILLPDVGEMKGLADRCAIDAIGQGGVLKLT